LEEIMSRQSTPILTFALLFLCAAAWTQDAIVPTRKEPLHVPKLENEFIRVLNVVIPPGKATLFHEHTLDFVALFVQGANLKNETPDGASAFPTLKTGLVAYNDYAAKPYIHRVSNLSDNPFWVVGSEILIPPPGKFQASNREAPYKVEIDNARVRVWRLILEPGQSAPTVTQAAPGLRVSLSDSKIVEQVAGRDQEVSLKKGEFIWQPQGSTRSLRHTGDNAIELVEYELK
jgi:hypothetical protein